MRTPALPLTLPHEPTTRPLRHGLTAIYVLDREARARRLLARTPATRETEDRTDRCGAPTTSGRPCRNAADVCQWHGTQSRGGVA